MCFFFEQFDHVTILGKKWHELMLASHLFLAKLSIFNLKFKKKIENLKF
jgi:hypothetical protein